MKCCVTTDVGTGTTSLTFEPDPDHSPDAGTGVLSPTSYRLRNLAALPRLPASVVLKWFYSLSRRDTFVGGKCALPSALLDLFLFLQVRVLDTALSITNTRIAPGKRSNLSTDFDYKIKRLR